LSDSLPSNNIHALLSSAAANIFANVFNIPEVKDREEVRRRAAAIPIPAYVFKGTKIKLDDGTVLCLLLSAVGL